MDALRIGYVSSYRPDEGTADVYYPDRNGEVSAGIPVLAPFGIRQNLNKEQMVLVAHLENGPENGVVIGPVDGTETETAVTASDGEITLSGSAGSMTLSEMIDLKNRE